MYLSLWWKQTIFIAMSYFKLELCFLMHLIPECFYLSFKLQKKLFYFINRKEPTLSPTNWAILLLQLDHANVFFCILQCIQSATLLMSEVFIVYHLIVMSWSSLKIQTYFKSYSMMMIPARTKRLHQKTKNVIDWNLKFHVSKALRATLGLVFVLLSYHCQNHERWRF